MNARTETEVGMGLRMEWDLSCFAMSADYLVRSSPSGPVENLYQKLPGAFIAVRGTAAAVYSAPLVYFCNCSSYPLLEVLEVNEQRRGEARRTAHWSPFQVPSHWRKGQDEHGTECKTEILKLY